MQYFHSLKKVNISEDEIRQALQFAQMVMPTVNYRDSNQHNLLKIQDDHFISKIGEEAVRKVFEFYQKKVIGPDYNIYTAKEKSWEEDLFVEGVGLAVKTQKWSSAKRYGLSWTFQSSGIRKDPILKMPEAWVCFALCNDLENNYQCFVYPPIQIKNLVFKKPKLSHLWGKKAVVYAGDLEFD